MAWESVLASLLLSLLNCSNGGAEAWVIMELMELEFELALVLVPLACCWLTGSQAHWLHSCFPAGDSDAIF